MAGFLTLAMAAKLLTALLLGGMVWFSFVFAPLVFKKLPKETAGAFISQVFPVYYWSSLVLTFLAMVTAADWTDRIILTCVAGLFGVAIFGFLPSMNGLRDRANAGDEAAGKAFARWHGISMVVNLIQMIAVLAAFLRLVR